jgi:membrane protein implicated in regulation of membrane protease activity
VLAVVAFCVFAVAGLPLLTRYLLLPATLLTLFAGAGVAGWTALARDDPARWPWLALAAVTVVLLAAFAPSQARRLDRLQAALATQTAILDELRGYLPRPVPAGCAITLPNRRAVPQVALWTRQDAGRIGSAQTLGRYRGSAFAPASPAVAGQFVLDRRDADRTLPPPPAGRPDAAGRYWRVWVRCGP